MDAAPGPAVSEILSADWTPLGTHRWRFVRPILSMEIAGDFTVADFDAYVATYRKLWTVERNFGLLANAAGMNGTYPEVRRRIVKELPSDGPAIPIAVLGASLTMRTVLTLVSNAHRLLFGDQPSIGFFANEPAARAWLLLRVAERARKLEALAGRR